jgi:holin-like protein
MIQGLALLVAGQLVGEAVVTVTGLPVPSAVVGMVFVLAALLARKGQMPEVKRAGHTLLMLVPLFLVPVSVGIMAQFDALRADAWPLTVALCVSVVLGMAATGLAVRWFSRFDGAVAPAGAADPAQQGDRGGRHD